MTIPLWTLLGFIAWTLVMLLMLAFCRWSHITKGEISLQSIHPGQNSHHPSDWHRRATRAHLNCLENLPIYTGLILVAYVINLQGFWFDVMAVTFLVARIMQSLVHLSVAQTNRTIPWRSLFYGVQFVVYIAIIVMIVDQSLRLST